MNSLTETRVAWGVCPWLTIPIRPVVHLSLTDGAFRLYCVLAMAAGSKVPLTFERICLLRNSEVEWAQAEVGELVKHGFLCRQAKDDNVFVLNLWSGEHVDCAGG